MPMDFGYLDLELDAVEERGAGRVPQEMAKSNSRQENTHPKGIHPNLLSHKMRKTERAVRAKITQVMRRERE